MIKDILVIIVAVTATVFIVGSIIHYVASEIEYWKWRRK